MSGSGDSNEGETNVKKLDLQDNFTYRSRGERPVKIVNVVIAKQFKEATLKSDDQTTFCGTLSEMFVLYMAIENFRRIINECFEENLGDVFRMSADFSKRIQRIGFFDYDLDDFTYKWYHDDDKIDNFHRDDPLNDVGICDLILKKNDIFYYFSRDIVADFIVHITMTKPKVNEKVTLVIRYEDKVAKKDSKSERFMFTLAEMQVLHYALYDFCRKKLGDGYKGHIWRREANESKEYEIKFDLSGHI